MKGHKLRKAKERERRKAKDHNIAKAENRIGRLVTKLMPSKAFSRPLPEQVEMAEAMIGRARGGMVEVRANLLKDRGIPQDVRDMHKAGKSVVEIKEYYWGCKPFREFWDRLEMTEAMLDSLIDTSLGGA